MVAWLTSAVPGVGGVLLELALGERAGGPDEFDLSTQVVVQAGRLDALLVTPSAAVVVESKLGSGYGDSQLRRYADWLATEHADRVRGLMTLTRNPAPWPASDLAHAEALEVVPSARRWEELHELLEPLSIDTAEISAELVREFMEMLAEEGLVPMRPLSEAELGDVWSASRTVVVRYHEFFRACKSAIAEALDADVMPNSYSDHHDYVWQDFRLQPDRERLLVGIWHTDQGVPLKPAVYRNAPIVWIAVDGSEKWPNWKQAADHLDTTAPEGWRTRGKRWWGRPEIWCYLEDAVGQGGFDEQRDHLAEMCSRSLRWLAAARTVSE
jgi:hypothetical protein